MSIVTPQKPQLSRAERVLQMAPQVISRMPSSTTHVFTSVNKLLDLNLELRVYGTPDQIWFDVTEICLMANVEIRDVLRPVVRRRMETNLLLASHPDDPSHQVLLCRSTTALRAFMMGRSIISSHLTNYLVELLQRLGNAEAGSAEAEVAAKMSRYMKKNHSEQLAAAQVELADMQKRLSTSLRKTEDNQALANRAMDHLDIFKSRSQKQFNLEAEMLEAETVALRRENRILHAAQSHDIYYQLYTEMMQEHGYHMGIFLNHCGTSKFRTTHSLSEYEMTMYGECAPPPQCDMMYYSIKKLSRRSMKQEELSTKTTVLIKRMVFNNKAHYERFLAQLPHEAVKKNHFMATLSDIMMTAEGTRMESVMPRAH